MDLGLRNSASLAHSADEKHLIETVVYQNLRRKFGNNVFYWAGENEIDFVIREGNTITQLWQVVAGGLDDDKILTREVKAFEEAIKVFPNAETFIITKSLPKTSKLPFHILPLWLFLLNK